MLAMSTVWVREAKAFKEESECDIFGKPTTARVARIAKSEKYKLKVDTYRKEKKQETLNYEETAAPSTNVHASDLLSDEAYAALVDSLIDDEDDVESEFSPYKCAMIRDGTYYAKTEEDKQKEKMHRMKMEYESNL